MSPYLVGTPLENDTALEAGHLHPFGRVFLPCVVLSDVLASTNKLQVFKPIIATISVSVMDVFVGSENTAEMAFHDDSMFKPVLAAKSDQDVTVRTDETSAFPVAVSKARSPSGWI